MYIKLTVDSAATEKDLARLAKRMPTYLRGGLDAIGTGMVGKIQHNRLEGQSLRVRSGQLRNRMAFNIERSGAGEDTVYLGTNVLSDQGFNYPAHWEMLAESVRPKPYIQPEIDAQRDYIARTFAKAIKSGIQADFK